MTVLGKQTNLLCRIFQAKKNRTGTEHECFLSTWVLFRLVTHHLKSILGSKNAFQYEEEEY